METDNQYYVVRSKALPEVLLKVVEAKRLLESGSAASVQDATETVDMSRSSFYKYKDDIFPFHDNTRGRTVTFVLQMDDVPGALSEVLKTIADYGGNVLTINQTIPINDVASLTLSVEMQPESGDTSTMMEYIERLDAVHYIKILARE